MSKCLVNYSGLSFKPVVGRQKEYIEILEKMDFFLGFFAFLGFLGFSDPRSAKKGGQNCFLSG